MSTFEQILGLIGTALMMYLGYQSIKSRPDLLEKEKIQSSFFTMGLLSLILIVFVALLVHALGPSEIIQDLNTYQPDMRGIEETA